MTPASRSARRPKQKKRSGGFGRMLLLGVVGAGAALALSEGLRKKVLDALFGAEEEFEYTSTTSPLSPPPAAQRSPDLTPLRCGQPQSVTAGHPGWPASYDRALGATTTAERSSTRCARRSRSAASPARRSTTSPREAGVSRGLLHYYFGTKERLLVEVVRSDCDLRIAALEERLAARAAPTTSSRCWQSLEGFSPTTRSTSRSYEMFTLSQRNDEIAAEFAQLLRRGREHVARCWPPSSARASCTCTPSPSRSPLLFALGDGLAIRMLAEPDRDWAPTVDAAELAVRALLA